MVDYGREMAKCFVMNERRPFQERVQEPEETGEAQRKEVNSDRATSTGVLLSRSLYSHNKPIKLFALKEGGKK